jgi:hypothetical protein
MLSAGGKKFTTAHECPLHIFTEGSLPRFIGLRRTDEGSILFEHTTYFVLCHVKARFFKMLHKDVTK